MENKEKKMLTTEDLNRTLGKKELYSIAFGHVIGSGVFSLIGIGIGYTGKSAWIGILLSAVFILLQALPFIVMAGTARFRGGYYSMMGTLWGPKFAGFYIVIFFASNVSLAMYAISFAQYLQGVLPQVPIVPVAVACLTVFFITNLLGIEGAAKLEIVMDIVLALAMTCFIVFGLPNVDYSTLFTVDFAPAGPMGIITCAVLLTWATAGGIDMVNLSAEAKNPTKDLPQVILVATIAIAIFYALIAMVAGGVLPVSETANQPLDLVARAIMPTPVFLFFVIGGALLALTTTLNATFAWITKPILQACNDGWLPHKIGYIHPKFKTPVIILVGFYIVGLIPILTGLQISMIADTAVVLSNILFAFICFGTVFIPQRMPELWEVSAFRCSKSKLYLKSILGGVSCVVMVLVLFFQMSQLQAIILVIITVIAILFAQLRYRSGAVKPVKSYEKL